MLKKKARGKMRRRRVKQKVYIRRSALFVGVPNWRREEKLSWDYISGVDDGGKAILKIVNEMNRQTERSY